MASFFIGGFFLPDSIQWEVSCLGTGEDLTPLLNKLCAVIVFSADF
jgi:hypothetical protein